MKNWPQGIGETNGDSLITQAAFQSSGDVWYVDSVTGNDSNDGRNRVRPLATLAHAISVCAALDTIVCLDGHQETLDATAITKDGLTIVGAGNAGGLPTVKITPGNETGSCLNVQQPGLRIRNIWFKERATSNDKVTITYANAGTDPNGCEIDGCYFECGTKDLGKKIQIGAGANYLRISNTKFVCTATSGDTEPLIAIGFVNSVSPYAMRMLDVTFDGGVDGFSNYWAFDSSNGAGIRAFLFERISLLNGADMKFRTTATADTGILQVGLAQGGSRIDW